jgi:PAS domain S-box-containing protein
MTAGTTADPSATDPRDPADLFNGGGVMGRLMRSVKWDATSLGPIEVWPQSLRSGLSICLRSRYPIAIYWGPDLALLYNEAWSAILGDKHPWALGRPAREVWPEIWDAIDPLFERVVTTGEGVWQEDELLPMHRHGYTEECYFNFTFSPVLDEEGRVGGIFNAVIETTYRVIAERRSRVLRQLAERTSGAQSQEEACILAAAALADAPEDLPFVLLYLVRGTEARLASAVRLLPGTSVSPEVVPLTGRDSKVGPWPLAQAMSGGTARVDDLDASEGSLPRGPWNERARSALVLPLNRAGQEAPFGLLVAGVSPRRALDEDYRGFLEGVAAQVATAASNAMVYEEERRRADALAELDRAKTMFFSNVSHEFRTPLTLMLGPLEDLLEAPGLTPEVLNQATVARRNALRLSKLVNSLLDFSRLEAGRVDPQLEPIDLAALTTDLASTFRSAVERAGLRLVVNCPALPSLVYVDRDMWEKIVLNLLSNAFKFTFEGEIGVTLRQEDGAIKLRVSDSGTGIPVEELPHVFERFRRVQNARARTHEGTGIGLALVHELVRLHGGQVGITSEVGQGTTFEVSLPARPAHIPHGGVVPSVPAMRVGPGAAPFVEEALRWLPSSPMVNEPRANELPLSAHSDQLARSRILVADDNADMREYIAHLLGASGSIETVADGQTALARAKAEPFDLVLSDVMMPGLDGFELVKALREDLQTRDMPIILLSARAGEESRVEGLQGGADDYLVKPFSARELIARVESSLNLARLRRETTRLERELRGEAEARQQQFASLAENLPDPVIRFDREQRHIYVNRAVAELSGRPVEYFLGRRVAETDAAPELRRRWQELLGGLFAGGPQVEWEFDFPGPNGSRRLMARMIPEHAPNDEVNSVIAICTDVTVQRQTEERLRQAAKMEAIGRLAGGIAHDFNNQLHGVSGFANLVGRDPGLGASSRADLQEIAKATERMAGLTRQLLAFSRQQVLALETLDLNAAVNDARSLLQRLIGANVEMIVDLLPKPLWVLADRAQLLQVLMNLAINARDAMPAGGRLILRTSTREVTIAATAAPGHYAELSVTDAGVGIAAADLPHIFDPFFTTKDVGQGTGLGLATVHGIVSQSNGYIWAESTLGKGTTFTVLLPTTVAPAPAAHTPHTAAHAPSRRYRVLVVDDEEVVRTIVARTLESEEYEVIQASDAREALEYLARERGNIDLVLSDVVMPGLSAHDFADRLVSDHPHVRLAWMSGYPRDSFDRLDLGTFFQKPIPADVLLGCISELLAEAAPAPRQQ